jgi:hypothetical protein
MEISKHGKNLNLPAPHFQLPVSSSENQLNAGEIKRTEDVKSDERLIQRLSSDASVRNRLLIEVQAKFLAGDYITRAAIEKAAEHILGL